MTYIGYIIEFDPKINCQIYIGCIKTHSFIEMNIHQGGGASIQYTIVVRSESTRHVVNILILHQIHISEIARFERFEVQATIDKCLDALSLEI